MISARQLAKMCGVSHGTIMRALNGKGRINPATKARILEAAARYRYKPNPIVQETITRASRMVGAIIPETSGSGLMRVLMAISEELHARGLILLVSPADSEERYHNVLDEFAARRVRAVLVVPPVWKLVITPAHREHLRIASFPHKLPYGEIPVLADDAREAATMQAQHLLSLGHERILLARPANSLWMYRQFESGFRAAMRDRGLKARVVTLPDITVLDGVPPAVLKLESKELLSSGKATAVCCINDGVAFVLIRELRAAGIRVPEDVSVIGMGGTPEFQAICPELTTVVRDDRRIGQAIAAWCDTGKVTKFSVSYSVRNGSSVCKAT